MRTTACNIAEHPDSSAALGRPFGRLRCHTERTQKRLRTQIGYCLCAYTLRLRAVPWSKPLPKEPYDNTRNLHANADACVMKQKLRTEPGKEEIVETYAENDLPRSFGIFREYTEHPEQSASAYNFSRTKPRSKAVSPRLLSLPKNKNAEWRYGQNRSMTHAQSLRRFVACGFIFFLSLTEPRSDVVAFA